MIGVDEANWQVTGCPAPGGAALSDWDGDLATWASDCLVPIAFQCSPHPRIATLRHAGGVVLVAAVSRSANLVYCVEAGKPLYYFRFHDKTLQAPEYLISDLMLGRRQHPDLRITDCLLADLAKPSRDSGRYVDLGFSLEFTVANQGLSWARDVRLGIVSWNRHRHTDYSDYLLRYIDVQEPSVASYEGDCAISHFPSSTVEGPTLEPFAAKTLNIAPNQIIPLRALQGPCTPFRWQAAVYLMSRGSPPIWYQLTLVVDSSLLKHADSQSSLSLESELLQFERVSAKLPVVAWDSI